MEKSAVAGLAGAARVDQLSMAELSHAERHGKRLDEAGKARAINNDPPMTTTGLDLQSLFRAHVAGAFVPKARAKAMQVIIQFPKDLVDGDDAALMLHHARAFTAKVFGPEAIFADRVDRDEKGRHLVDLFIAPKYLKRTKRDAKVAVTMSRHQKELAQKHSCPPTPIGTGRALQQALFEYLRDDMGLVGVKRGEPKLVPGPDWKASEQLRDDELKARQVELAIAEAVLSRREAAAADREVGLDRREREAADLARRDAAALIDQEAALTLRIDNANRRERLLAEREVEIADALARAEVAQAAASAARDEAERLAAECSLADMAAQAARDAAVADAVTTRKERHEAERVREAAVAAGVAIDAERRLLATQRQQDEEQLALLSRATDDEQKLGLQETNSSFWMNERAMNTDEQAAYRRLWPDALIRMALHLARALETVREAAALADIQQWTKVLERLARYPNLVEFDEHGAILLDQNDRAMLPQWFVTTVKKTPPSWAATVIGACRRVNAATEQAQQREQAAADAALQLDDLIARAGPLMTPEQEAFATEGKRTTGRWAALAQTSTGLGS